MFLDLLLEFAVFLFGLAALQGALDEDFEPVDVDGLGDEVVGAVFHGLDGRIDGAVGGHHDADGGMREAQGAVDKLHAILGAEAQVGDHEVDGVVLEDAEGAGDVSGDVDVEAVLERGAQPLAGVLFVVND